MNVAIADQKVLTKLMENPDLLTAQRCRRNFYTFVQEFWDTIINEKPIWNWHIKYLCRELQKVVFLTMGELPKEYDLIINVPPGSTKSTIATVMLPIWAWIAKLPSDENFSVAFEQYAIANALKSEDEQFPYLTGRHMRFIAGSHADRLATDHSVKSRDIIKHERFSRYFPEVVIRKDVDSKSHFKNTAGGERISTSVGGSITGQHGHIQIVDDPIDPKGTNSDVERKSANEWMNQTLSTRKVSKENTPLILIMQRLHEDDPTGHKLLKGEDGARIKHICLPGEVTKNIKPIGLKRFYKDGLLDPVRLSRAVLKDMEVELGQYGYAGQVLQTPTPPAGGMFKVERMDVVTALPGRPIRSVRYWDKAGTEGVKNPNAAWTCGVLLHLFRDKTYVISDVVRGQWGSDIREKTIKQTAEMDGQEVEVHIEQEPGSGGLESAQNTIKNLAGFVCKKDKVTANKALRADTYSVQVNEGNVALLRGPWNREYTEELRHFPVSKWKDQVDASSGAFNALHAQKKAGTWGSGRERS